MSRNFKTTDTQNNVRKIAYYKRVATHREADPIGFQVRFLRGCAFQRDLYKTKRANVIALHSQRKDKQA